MKRFLALLVSLLLLLTPVIAMGEAAENVEYADPNGRFTFVYPADWTVLTTETIDALAANAEKEGNEGYKFMLEGIRPQIEELGMIIVMSADMISSISIVPQDAGEEVTNEMVAALKDSAVAEVTAAMGDVTFTAEPGMMELGDGRQALMVQYTFPLFEGMDLYGVQVYAGVGSTLFAFSMTSEPDRAEADAEVLGIMLGSMQAN